jgi:hypothetical protein
MDAMEYRRPLVTASFDALRRRRLPQVLFVHPYLPEGVTVCDISGFAAMIEEAYRTPNTLNMRMELDEDGLLQGIAEILIAPEADGQRVCTVEPIPTGREHLLASRRPITFSIQSRL